MPVVHPFAQLPDVRWVAALLIAATPGTAQQLAWPEYRGPAQNGQAPAARVPLHWSEQRNVRWKTPIHGRGWSTPAVGEGRVWVTTAAADGRTLSVLALELATGRVLVDRVVFQVEQPRRINRLNSYASPSPVLEAGRVYVHFGSYGTACLRSADGTTVWQRRDIPCDHMEGPGSSPALCGDVLVFHCDGGDVQQVVALDKRTGATRWQKQRTADYSRLQPDQRKAYSTPLQVEVAGRPLLVCSGAEQTTAIEPTTGAPVWTVRYRGFSMSSRPVLATKDLVVLNTGFMSTRLLAVDVGGKGDVTESHVRWTYRRNVPRMASPIAVEGRLYMVSDNGIATCLDAATGKRIWMQRIGGAHCASPVFAGGRIYFFDREGRSVVVAPGPQFRELASNRLAAGFMASPAVVGNALILRTETHLYRIEEAAPVPTDAAAATGWSRFRGPNGTGVAAAEDLPTELGPDKNVVFRRALPSGHSSPVLAGRSIFLTALDGDRLFTYCLDATDGAVRWRREAPRPRRAKLDPRNHPANASPVADADTVVVFFEEFGLLAYGHDGTPRWQIPLGPFDNVYGMGASPVLLGDRVYLACDQSRDSFLLCADKRSGATLWRVPRPQAASGHCTPIVYNPSDGAPQIVVPGSFQLDAYDAASGARVWWVNGLSFEMKSTPVLDDGVIYINGYGSPLNQPGRQVTLPEFAKALAEHDRDKDGVIRAAEMPKSPASDFFDFVDRDHSGGLDAGEWAFLRAALASQNGMLAITAGGRGDRSATAVRWTYRRPVPQLPSPLLLGGALYMLHDQSGLITLLRPKDGTLLAKGRLKGAVDSHYASPVGGDGKVYCVSESGLVTVLRAGTLEVIASADLRERCYATPAIVGRRIYVRTAGHLYCFAKPKAERR